MEPEARARDAEREGNVHMANGLALKAKASYRRADAIRRKAPDTPSVAGGASRDDDGLLFDACHEINQRWGEPFGDDMLPIDQALVRETAEAILAPIVAERDALSDALGDMTVHANLMEQDRDRLRSIIDRPDPHDFMVASEIEARFQLGKWGTPDGFPTAFDNTDDPAFAYLIGYLVGEVTATPDESHDKKLHRVTTIAAAAANWHAAIVAREALKEGSPDA